MTELKQILKQLETISSNTTAVDGKVDELLKWQAKMEERCKNHLQSTKDVRLVLFGNPTGGLMSVVQGLQNCKDITTRWKDLLFSVLKVLIATGIVSMAAWLFMMYRIHDIT